MKYNYSKICSFLLKGLPERTKQVIIRRFGLEGEKESLASIGESLGITRERVRQIERDGLLTIQEKQDQKITDYFSSSLASFGGIKEEQAFVSYLGDQKNHIFFLLYLCNDIKLNLKDKDFYGFWYSKDKDIKKIKKRVNDILTFLKKEGRPVDLDKIETKIEKSFLESYLELSRKIKKDPEGRVGLLSWPEVNPRGVKDKAFLMLQKMGKPLHFAQLASLIEHSPFNQSGGKVYVTTVHNELIKDQRFVLVGRGIYALKDWGYQPGVVKDIIADTLKEKGPLNKDEILESVLQKRFVQENTVYLNLQDKKHFLRDEKGRYFVNRIREA